MHLLAWVNQYAAGLTAIFTFLYLIATILIFNEARRLTNAAEEAARSATRAAKLTAQLYRPHIGVQAASLGNHAGTLSMYGYEIRWTFKNFGTVPASHVRVLVECTLDCIDKSSSEIKCETDPGDAEVFPDPDQLTIRTILQLDGEQVDHLTRLQE